jgi:putative DNA primase/helicase
LSKPGHIAPASPFREKSSQTMTAVPNALDLKRENIPEELKGWDQWVGWSWKWVADRWTKIPYDLKTGLPASSTDPATWSTYEATKGHEKIGFVFTENDPYCGIDLDDCIDPETGNMSKEARLIVARFAAYAEVSPSGTGVKIFVKARVPGLRRKNPQKRMEIYDRGRFFAITGHLYEEG